MSLAPDTAVITLGVELFDPDASTAQREVERRMDAILAVFRQAGVPDQNITTVAYTIWVERDWNQPGGPVVGYRVTHLVDVRFQPVERVGEVLSRSVQAGANTIKESHSHCLTPLPRCVRPASLQFVMHVRRPKSLLS